jgi:hypothetical protein
VILIDRNQQNKVGTRKIIPKDRNKKIRKKMLIFNCSCGVKILVVPDLHAMNKAIKNHIVEHKKLSGQCLTEEILTQEILKVVLKAINET